MSESGPILPVTDAQVVETMRAEIEKSETSGPRRAIERFVVAALSTIPWVGTLVSAAANLKSEEESNYQNYLLKIWVEQHQRKLIELGQTLQEIQSRFQNFGDEINERIESEAYLALVRKAFRAWDQSDTEEKRRMLGNVVINAGSTRACPDDVIRLFIDWTELYNEVHFAVIREIFHNPGSTRFEIWSAIYGELPREDSEEADLFKFLIRELSTGGVIRQERDINSLGQFVRKRPIKRRGTPTTLESAFEDTKPYVLTQLGRKFVHYTMNETVTQLSAENPE
ncbi:MAG TPA: hypothetical protein VGI45_26515 [Terracidiphilus sp.]|jgi:hypothetical protein